MQTRPLPKEKNSQVLGFLFLSTTTTSTVYDLTSKSTCIFCSFLAFGDVMLCVWHGCFSFCTHSQCNTTMEYRIQRERREKRVLCKQAENKPIFWHALHFFSLQQRETLLPQLLTTHASCIFIGNITLACLYELHDSTLENAFFAFKVLLFFCSRFSFT